MLSLNNFGLACFSQPALTWGEWNFWNELGLNPSPLAPQATAPTKCLFGRGLDISWPSDFTTSPDDRYFGLDQFGIVCFSIVQQLVAGKRHFGFQLQPNHVTDTQNLLNARDNEPFYGMVLKEIGLMHNISWKVRDLQVKHRAVDFAGIQNRSHPYGSS